MTGKARPIYIYPRSGRKDFTPLGHLDEGTKAARILKNTRDALIKHCDGSPSITQLQIIVPGADWVERVAVCNASASWLGDAAIVQRAGGSVSSRRCPGQFLANPRGELGAFRLLGTQF